MKIIQLSDLHLDDNTDLKTYNDMIEQLIAIIQRECKSEEIIYIICCGDIVNKGNPYGYNNDAQVFFDRLSHSVIANKINYIFVPGNHDLCNNSFDDFNQFIHKYNNDIVFSDNVMLYKTNEIDFVLVNSCYHKDYSYGRIDIECLENCIRHSCNKPILLVMHHTLLSRYRDDRSAISDAYRFLDILEKYNVIGVLHGHTHGYSNIIIGNNCRVIGIGSLFAYIPNCNNQFNIVDIVYDKIERITNYRYNEDLSLFGSILLYENVDKTCFSGDKLSNLYFRVRESVKHFGGMSNLCINLSTTVDDYKKDMEKFFSDIFELASKWLAPEVPSMLYYNHGQYMVDSRMSGVEYLIDELTRNSTSNRAIIPLIKYKDILDHQFGHVPGLTSIQCGFMNDERNEIYCSVYLRSLEVNHFLRINIGEIYLILMDLCNEIRSIKKIVINIYAFRAQYKEYFSCFKKARIDTLSVGELSRIIYKGTLLEIIQLLQDKFAVEETVVNTTGLDAFLDILKSSQIYEEEIIEKLSDITEEMRNLKEEYKKSSNYVEIIPIESRLHVKQSEYLRLLNKYATENE